MFDYFLAEKLHMPVAAVRRISGEEYLGWAMYYANKASDAQLAQLKGGGHA